MAVTFFLTSLSLFLNCLCIWLRHFTWHIIFFTCCMHLLSLQVADEFVKRREETEWWAYLIWESILSENREFCAFKQAMWRYWTARLEDETLLMLIKISNWATLKFNPWYILENYSYHSVDWATLLTGLSKVISIHMSHGWGGRMCGEASQSCSWPHMFYSYHLSQFIFSKHKLTLHLLSIKEDELICYHLHCWILAQHQYAWACFCQAEDQSTQQFWFILQSVWEWCSYPKCIGF